MKYIKLFEEETSGKYFLYNIEPTKVDDQFTFDWNIEILEKFIKSHVSGISKNELKRYFAFTLQEFIDKMPSSYFENKDMEKIQKYLEKEIASSGKHWMGMHSDASMRKGMQH